MTNDLPPGHRLRGLFAATLVIAAILASFPFSPLVFGDDFSYMRTAWDFARTGHLIYNGWGAPMLGWLAVWGALFTKCFGSGADVLRSSMLILAAACIYLFHEILLRFGIAKQVAFFSALVLGLSPLYFPLASSFMTDIPGLLVILLCIWMCQRAVIAEADSSSVAWLVAAAAVNVVGGTVRQICWLGVLVMVPATAWFLRRRQNMVLAAIASWVGSAVAIYLCMRWLSHQMYNLPEPLLPQSFQAHNVGRLFSQLYKGLFCFTLILAPLAVAALANVRRLSRKAFLRLGILLLLAIASWVWPWHHDLNKALMPWLEPILVVQGMSEPHGPLEYGPALHLPLRIVLSTLNVILAWASIESIALFCRKTRAKQIQRNAAFWILAPFSLAVFLLLLPRAYDVALQDRYLLLLSPAMIVLLAFVLHRSQTLVMPRISYGLLLVFCAYGIAGLHDERSAARSFDRSAAMLLAAGVPRTSIVEGFGPDELVQIAHTGRVNNPGMWPHSAYDPDVPPPYLPEECSFLAAETPLIRPGFLIVARLGSCVAGTRFPAVPYKTWLPPYGRATYIATPISK